nr:P-type DNA transfer ATPase VirB11 [Phenylobacterium aquaticum]
MRAYLRPFATWLEQPGVTEILVNRPGEVWIESAGEPVMRRHEAPEVTDLLLERLAAQVARLSSQGVNRENPLLAASLPDGARIQMVGPPATRRHWAMAIRRHVLTDLPLEAYDHGPLAPVEALAGRLDPDAARADPVDFLRRAVLARRTILISGGTSSGKTTFLNSLLKIVPDTERLVLVEDTPEVAVRQPNALGLVAVKGELGEARIGVDDLLQAALRLRPDRIIVGEIRDAEAVTFLRAINTGHPGSLTTVHANSPEGALEQIVLMVQQTGLGLSRREVLDYVASLVDVVVQLGRIGGQRRILDLRVTQS